MSLSREQLLEMCRLEIPSKQSCGNRSCVVFPETPSLFNKICTLERRFGLFLERGGDILLLLENEAVRSRYDRVNSRSEVILHRVDSNVKCTYYELVVH